MNDVVAALESLRTEAPSSLLPAVLADVGLAEAEAFSSGRKIRVTKVPFSATAKAMINNDTRGFVKIISDPATGVVLGGSIVGRAAAELISVLAVAVTNNLKVGDILGEDPVPIDYQNVPWCIYCHPEVAFAGLTEEDAVDAGFDVVTAKHRFIPNGRAKIIGANRVYPMDAKKLPTMNTVCSPNRLGLLNM